MMTVLHIRKYHGHYKVMLVSCFIKNTGVRQWNEIYQCVGIASLLLVVLITSSA